MLLTFSSDVTPGIKCGHRLNIPCSWIVMFPDFKMLPFGYNAADTSVHLFTEVND
jgi:hypothetical protein